jgi:hypothetical protein
MKRRPSSNYDLLGILGIFDKEQPRNYDLMGVRDQEHPIIKKTNKPRNMRTKFKRSQHRAINKIWRQQYR